MAKKVTEVNESENLEIRNQHELLKSRVREAADNQRWWEKTCSDPRMREMLDGFDAAAEEAKESLVYAEKKDIDGIQASVKARRALLKIVAEKVSTDELVARRRTLEQFERDNALFLQPATAAASEA